MNRLVIIGILAALLPGVGEAKSYRDPKVRQAFVEQNPCPIYDEKAKKCLAEVDHMEPLCAGGKDDVSNLQYLSKEQHHLKTLMDIQRCAVLRREQKAHE